MVSRIENDKTVLFDRYMRTQKVLPLPVKAKLKGMAMKGYSTFPKAPETGASPLDGLVPYSGHSLEKKIDVFSNPRWLAWFKVTNFYVFFHNGNEWKFLNVFRGKKASKNWKKILKNCLEKKEIYIYMYIYIK